MEIEIRWMIRILTFCRIVELVDSELASLISCSLIFFHRTARFIFQLHFDFISSLVKVAKKWFKNITPPEYLVQKFDRDYQEKADQWAWNKAKPKQLTRVQIAG